MDEDDVKLEEEIQKIFTCVAIDETLNPRALDKAKEILFTSLKETVSQALKRSIARDGNGSSLEAKDLLSVIQNKGDIYKFAIARKLVIMKQTKIGENSNIDKVSKNIKPQQHEAQGNFSDSNNDEGK